MSRLKLAVPVLCIIILAAHFLREQSSALMLVSILGVPLLFVRRYWAARAMQLFFVLAGMEWIYTMIVLAMERNALGLPWIRMAMILTAVAILTLGSSLIVDRKDLKQ